MGRPLAPAEEVRSLSPAERRALFARRDAAAHILMNDPPKTEEDKLDLLLAVVAPSAVELQTETLAA